MAAPSWLPSWPSTWPDFVNAWRELVPAAWPLRLFRRAGDACKDLQATGEGLSMVRQALEWVLRCHLPPRDTEALFLDLWEEDFSLQPAATTAARVVNLTAKLREKATLTIERAKMLVGPAFGITDPDLLEVIYPTAFSMGKFIGAAGSGATDHEWCEAAFRLHFFPKQEGDITPDQDLFRSIANRIAPVSDYWTCGAYCYLVYDDGTLNSGTGYGISTYKDTDA